MRAYDHTCVCVYVYIYKDIIIFPEYNICYLYAATII